MALFRFFHHWRARRRPNSPELVASAWSGDVDAVSSLLTHDANPDSADPDEPPLYLPGSNVNLASRRTALSAAVQSNHPQIVSLLLETGANPNSLDRQDGNARWSPLLYAASLGHLECAKLLIAAGANVNYRADNYTVLTSAVSHVPVLIELLKSGADIRVTAPDIRACIRGRVIPDVVAILMNLNNGLISNKTAVAELETFV